MQLIFNLTRQALEWVSVLVPATSWGLLLIVVILLVVQSRYQESLGVRRGEMDFWVRFPAVPPVVAPVVRYPIRLGKWWAIRGILIFTAILVLPTITLLVTTRIANLQTGFTSLVVFAMFNINGALHQWIGQKKGWEIGKDRKALRPIILPYRFGIGVGTMFLLWYLIFIVIISQAYNWVLTLPK